MTFRPWRDVIAPHADVQSGRFQQAEFAADLAQVYQGRGSEEYLDPHEFFRRTYITVGLRDLLTGALQRMNDSGGDPVLELQTNFGGGKTHSMLALYHLFSGVEAASLEGIESVLADASVNVAPKAHRAVLVGTALAPGQVSVKPDGTEVKTIWGEMAWQLGGAKGYAMLADSDKNGTSPGSDTLSKLFRAHSPCLILIDEWVAYARQLFDKSDLPAGTFDSQGSFAQSITEAAKAAPKTLVVASIPQSRIEIGGENGIKALDVLKNIFSRVAKPWRAATGDEGFEIVRRRLFEPLTRKDDIAARDATIDAFAKMYRDNDKDFPRDCGEGTYRDEIRASYPIHPELFRRLYDDWSTLEKFHRTRGVLRLLAKVIYRLWEAQDEGLLIMPASVPMDDDAVKSELTRYLPDLWEPIISQDVDGPKSVPLKIDREIPNLVRYSACRRVARALFMGTAPTGGGTSLGLSSAQIRLACVQPGETIGTFNDALRRLGGAAQYIHWDEDRDSYRLSTRPNLNRTAKDRATSLLSDPSALHGKLESLLKSSELGDAFGRVVCCPGDSSAVPDDQTSCLVVLKPDQSHSKAAEESDAKRAAKEIFEHKGAASRLNRNSVVFVAPEASKLSSLRELLAEQLAWESILNDADSLGLDSGQSLQAKSKCQSLRSRLTDQIPRVWCIAIVPTQAEPRVPISLEPQRVKGAGLLGDRTARALEMNGLWCSRELAAEVLLLDVEEFFWKVPPVSYGELRRDFCRYCYLPRLRSTELLRNSVLEACSTDSGNPRIAVATAYNEESDSYQGLGTLLNHEDLVDATLLVPGTLLELEVVTPPSEMAILGGQARPVRTISGVVNWPAGDISAKAKLFAEEILAHIKDLDGVDLDLKLVVNGKSAGGYGADTVAELEALERVEHEHLDFDHLKFR